MGLDYSFELVVEIGRLERALVAIADALIPYDRERLLRSIGSDPVGSFDRIEGDGCFRFLFPADEEVLAFWGEVEPCGRVRCGCVWCHLWIEGEVAKFVATAPTTDTSLLFERSESIRGVWASIAEQCGALFVLFDDETYQNRVFWPYVGTLSDVLFEGEWVGWVEAGARAQRLAGRARA
jgi:hypothetical protein